MSEVETIKLEEFKERSHVANALPKRMDIGVAEGYKCPGVTRGCLTQQPRHRNDRELL